MNTGAHWLSLISVAVHLGIGLPELLRIGPRFLPASWVIIYSWLPDWAWWLWPGFYVLTALVALLGVHRTDMLRLGFLLSAAIHFTWGGVSVYGWATARGGTLPGSFTYWFLAVVLVVLARYVAAGKRSDKIDGQVAALAEKVEAANGR